MEHGAQKDVIKNETEYNVTFGKVPPEGKMTTEHRSAYWALLTLLLAISFAGISTGLWLDEAGTAWVVSDGWAEAVLRSTTWSGTGTGYFILVWLFRTALGTSEVVLRLPSLAASILTVFILVRLGRRWLDEEGALIATVLFFSVDAIRYTVIDARPYALGLCLFASAMLALMRWIETDRIPYMVLFGVLAAAVVWTHYTVALGFVCLLGLARQRTIRQWLLAGTVAAFCLIPLAGQVLATAQRRDELSFASAPRGWTGLYQIFDSVVGIPVLGLFLFVGGLFCLGRLRRAPALIGVRFVPGRQSFWVPALLGFVPPLLVIGLAYSGIAQVFVSRYLIVKSIGLALLAAWLIRCLTHNRMRFWLTAVVALMPALWGLRDGVAHSNEDWKASSVWIREEVRARPQAALAVVSGFIESARESKLDDPSLREILLAPQFVYPVPGEPVILPVNPGQLAVQKLRLHVIPHALESGAAVVLVRPLFPAYEGFLVGEFEMHGMALREVRDFGRLKGYRFERNPASRNAME